MAVKTKAQLLAEVASLLADNTTGDISASDVRTCLNDIIDSASYGGYSSAILQLAQTNVSTPVLRELSNNFAATWTTTYSGVGDYMLVQNGAFADLTKVWISGMSIDITGGFMALPIISSGSISGYLEIHVYNSDKLIIKVYDSATNPSNLSDLTGDGKYISLPEIRVYP